MLHLNIVYLISFRFRSLQVSADSKVSELHNETRLKGFEAERTQMVYEETCRTLKETQLEHEKLQKKLEVRLSYIIESNIQVK